MQNKQKALFAGNRARCKVTSSGPEHKQSSLPVHWGSEHWTLGIDSECLSPPGLKASPWRCISLQSFSEPFLGQKQGEALNRGCRWSCYIEGTVPSYPLHYTLTQLTQRLASRVFFQSPGQSGFTQRWGQTTSFVLIGVSLLLAEGPDFLPQNSLLWFYHSISLSMPVNNSNLLLTSHTEGPSCFRL